ncbi:MerR family transcriptional regulator [Sandaracinobacteroides saxicola]|nr:MerR family DNA-binding protein [Sandaracinobacteroides saxicola]
MSSFTVGQLAAHGDVGVETVRFYQRKGLLNEPPRHGGIRRYGSEDVRRLRFIKRAQAAGFTLSEIGELLRLEVGRDRDRVRELSVQRVAALNERIADLVHARDALQRLATTCAKGSKGPCPILASFEN